MRLNLKVWCCAWNLSFVMIRASLNLKICQTVSRMWFIYKFIGHQNPNVWVNIPHFYLLDPQISLFSITHDWSAMLRWEQNSEDTQRNRHSGPEYSIFGCRKVQKSLFFDVGKLWTEEVSKVIWPSKQAVTDRVPSKHKPLLYDPKFWWNIPKM